MRRICIAAISFLLAALIIFAVFNLFFKDTYSIPLLDLAAKERNATADGRFDCRFKSTQEHTFICGIDGKVEDDTLFVWVLGTSNASNALPVDDEGYVKLEFDAGESIGKVYYLEGETRQLLCTVE